MMKDNIFWISFLNSAAELYAPFFNLFELIILLYHQVLIFSYLKDHDGVKLEKFQSNKESKDVAKLQNY